MIDERIAARRAEVRGERRRGRLRRTIAILVAVVVVVALVLIERSDLVGLEEVQVVGAQRVGADEVRAAAGLELGTSTLRLSLRDAERRVAALPAVLDVTARRVDPLTVRIEIEERLPVLVAEGNGVRRLVDRFGVVLGEEDPDIGDDDADLSVVILTNEPPEVGEAVATDPALDNAYRAWRQFSGPLRTRIVRYDAPSATDLTLHLDHGVEVRFGRAERVDEKVRAIGAVLGDLSEADAAVEIIDVRAPSAPVVIGGREATGR